MNSVLFFWLTLCNKKIALKTCQEYINLHEHIFGTKNVRGQFFIAIAKKDAKKLIQRTVAFGSLTGDPQSHGVPFSPFWSLK